ncbi:MAG: hypothetical protein Q7S57_02900 [bacterium]|nr:hypothetical protein [bacterium]
MAEEKLIVLLETRAGKNPGEAVATHNRRQIVFLPRGTTVGVNVRVVLEEITTKKDSNGRSMYRGVPAPVEYVDKWKINGDGRVSKITVSKDWLGGEREEGVIETRQPATRDGSPWTQTESTVSWGATLANCAVDLVDTTTTPLETEYVEAGQLVWRKTSERVGKNTRRVTVTGIRVTALDATTWQPAYPPDWQISASVAYDGGTVSTSVTWANAPKETRDEIENRYCVCACSRQRYDVQNSDGYAKCEKCREKEHCVRCGKQVKVAVIADRLICANCRPYEDREQLINRVVPNQTRQELAQQATRLLAGNVVPREAGEAIVRSTLGQVEPDWKRNGVVEKCVGYAWYYFCEEGVYGSKFPSAALQILQGLPQATGNGLVDLVSWVAGRQKQEECERCGDFFCESQAGRFFTPSPSESELQNLCVAVRLRGSEADRIEALQKYRELVEKLGSDAKQVSEIAEILNSDEQDYAAVLVKIHNLGKDLASAERGEILVNFGGHFRMMGYTGQAQYWVIRPDGSEREPDEVDYRKRYTSEGNKKWWLVSSDELAISWFKGTTASSHQCVVDKLPAGGCTPEQLATVAQLEQELSARFEGSHGCSGDPSPNIGEGWNLKSKDEPDVDEPYEIGPPAPANTLDVHKLFGGQVRKKPAGRK